MNKTKFSETAADNWVCTGIPHNKQDYQDYQQIKSHPPFTNDGAKCKVCGLPKEAAIKTKSRTSKATIFKLLAGLGSAGLILLLGVGLFRAKPQSCVVGQAKANEICLTDNVDDTSSSPNKARKYTWEPERFNWGQKAFFSGEINIPRDQGIAAFKAGKYDHAASLFKRAISGNRNDPESLILYNNALAHNQGNPLTLAAVVPIDNNEQSAREILRGIAQAQHQFNQSQSLQKRLLEIVIANDGNEPDNAKLVAQQLVADQSILGVVGHNSSDASQAGLEVYESGKLAMISPTSTSTTLKGEYFFRTLPDDSVSGIKLAQHTFKKLKVKNAVVFYNPASSYSSSLKEAFENHFKQLGGNVIARDITNPNLNFDIEIAMNILQNHTQAVLLFPNTDYVSVAIEIAKANANLPEEQRLKLLGGDALYSSETLTAGGKSLDKLVLAVPWFIDSLESQIFSQAAESQWGGAVNWRTAMSFDATQAFIKTFSDKISRPQVRQNIDLVQLQAEETSGREFSFSMSGERQSEPILVEVTQGGRSPTNSKYGYSLVDK